MIRSSGLVNSYIARSLTYSGLSTQTVPAANGNTVTVTATASISLRTVNRTLGSRMAWNPISSHHQITLSITSHRPTPARPRNYTRHTVLSGDPIHHVREIGQPSSACRIDNGGRPDYRYASL